MDQGAFTIREAIEQDTPALRQLYLQCRIDTFHWLNTRLFKLSDLDKDTVGERLFVAELKECIIGFIGVWVPDNFIHHLYVDRQYQQRGTGKALLHHVLTLSYRPFSLKCLELNIKAYEFYARQGWQIKRRGIGNNGPYFLMVNR